MRSIIQNEFVLLRDLTICCLVALVVSVPGTAANGEQESAALRRVRSFLTRQCVDCHGEVDPAGGVRLDQLSEGPVARNGELWLRVLEQIATGNMPPAEEPRPDRAAVARVVHAIHDSLKSAGLAGELSFPDKGNHVPHSLLFGPGAGNLPPPASPARLWRLTPRQYDALAQNVGGRTYRYTRRFVAPRGALPTAFAFRGGPGLQDYSALYNIDAAQTEQMVLNAREVARRVLDRENRLRPPAEIAEFAGRSELTGQERESVVQLLARHVFKHELEEDRLQPYVEFLGTECQRGGVQAGLKSLLAVLLLHPEAVYRIETADGVPDEHGRVRLAPLQLARALAFALTDNSLDRKLLTAVENGRLQTREDVRREAERLLDSVVFSRETYPSVKPLNRFFQEYFGYAAAPDVFKDEELLRPQQRMYLVEDTNRLISLILQEDRQVLRELLTTDRSFVMSALIRKPPRAATNNKRGGTHLFGSRGPVNEPYSLKQEDWTPEQPLRFENRRGILMQPSWLIARSQNGVNDAVRRGKWVRERLLGGAIPDIPITVDAQLPDEPDKPLRERMRVTRKDYCWKCHQRMDPLGLAFEGFDDWGRSRTEESGQAVQTTGQVLGADDEQLNGPVRDAAELVERLARSDYVEQVFVRHAFRFWMGRNETPRDAPVLQAAWRAYHDNDGSMKELVLSLLTSDAFLYRYTPNKPADSHSASQRSAREHAQD